MSQEIKDEIKNIGEAWEASKKAQDEVNAGNVKGLAELKEKQDRIDADLNASLDMKKELEDVAAAVKRMGAADVEKEDNREEIKAYDSAMKKWVKAKCPDALHSLGLNEKELKAMSSNVDPDGGYTVMPFFGATEGIVFDTSPIRALASVQTINTDEYVGFYDDDEVSSGWIGEIGTRAEGTTPDIGEFRIQVREAYTRLKISQRLLEDSSWNMEGYLPQKSSEKMARLEATGFVTGTGILQPQGITTGTAKTANADVYTRGQIGTKVAASASVVTSDELIETRALLKAAYRGNAIWAYNRATESGIRKLTDGQGNYLWQPSFQAGEPDMLIGQRTAIFEDMPDQETGANAILLGDIRSTYQIVDRAGISVLRDVYTASVTGQVIFQVRKRTGGGIKNWDSMKYLQQA